MYRKLFALLLALSMALSLAAGVCAEGAMSGTCGENAVWSYADGTLTISGTGSTYDYREVVNDQDVVYPRPWDAFREEIRYVVIEEGITWLGMDAFIQTPNLQSVELPGTLTGIGSFAFFECTSLASAELPEGLRYLGQQCFHGTALTTMEIPASVTFVDGGVFESCKSLTDVYFHSDPNLPSFITAYSLFRHCSSLEQIQVEEGHISMKSIDGVLYLGDPAFGTLTLTNYPGGRKDTTFRVPDGTVRIGQFAMEESTGLETVVIPDSVTNIDTCAMARCPNLKTVRFEGSAPELEGQVFCLSNLTAYYPAGDSTWEVIGSWSEEYLVGEPTITGEQGSITWEAYAPEIAEGVCGDNAVWHYKNGKLTISGTGELYDKWTIDNEVWFALRDKITHVVVEDGITYIGSYSFGWCRNLSSVTLSDTVTDIGSAAFCYCEALKSIDLPNGLSAIGDNAFGHSGLREIEIPEAVTFLGAVAFANCERLTDVLIRGNPDLPGMTTGNSVFESCSSLAEIRVEESHPFLRSIDGCLYIEDYDGSLRLNSYPAGRTETTLTVVDRTVSIEQYAFRGAKWLEQVEIPGSVAEMGSGVFQDAGSLKQVTFFGSAPEFGNSVFDNCTLEIRVPVGDPSWDDRESWALGGSITWTVYNPANPFTDVPVGVFYEAPVIWAVENGITSGAGPDTFYPGGDCLRAQVVTFLWRAAGQPEPSSGVNPFVDVSESDFYYKAVLWAVEKGITNGADATHFNPFGICNRAQVVTFLHRAFGSPAVENGSNPFTDVPAESWYTAPVLWAVEKGITNGLSAAGFGPNANCNRAQIVTFLYRAYH